MSWRSFARDSFDVVFDSSAVRASSAGRLVFSSGRAG